MKKAQQTDPEPEIQHRYRPDPVWANDALVLFLGGGADYGIFKEKKSVHSEHVQPGKKYLWTCAGEVTRRKAAGIPLPEFAPAPVEKVFPKVPVGRKRINPAPKKRPLKLAA